jgi:predicted metalloprotease with PDZ domain
VSGDRAFAREFFAHYIQGHDVAEYGRLLAHAGFTVRKRNAGHAWLGDLRLEARTGVHVANLVAPTWPIYNAGIDQDDELRTLDAQRVTGDGDVQAVLQRHKPGDSIGVGFVDRTGVLKTTTVTLGEDPHIEVVSVDSLTAAQRSFRERWLGAR